MKRLGKQHNEEEADIDITPMLDIVFIMLIFFIVTASFVKESGLDLNKPPVTDTPPDADAPRPIIVEINDLSEIRIDDRLLDERAIKATITRLTAERPEASVIIKTEKKAKTKAIIAAVDGIKAAGVLAPTISLAKD